MPIQEYTHVIKYEEAAQDKKLNEQRARQALQEFNEQKPEMLSSTDFEYYSNLTGIPVEYLLGIAADNVMIQNSRESNLMRRLRKKRFYTEDIKWNPFKEVYMKYWYAAQVWLPLRYTEARQAIEEYPELYFHTKKPKA